MTREHIMQKQGYTVRTELAQIYNSDANWSQIKFPQYLS